MAWVECEKGKGDTNSAPEMGVLVRYAGTKEQTVLVRLTMDAARKAGLREGDRLQIRMDPDTGRMEASRAGDGQDALRTWRLSVIDCYLGWRMSLRRLPAFNWLIGETLVDKSPKIGEGRIEFWLPTTGRDGRASPNSAASKGPGSV